MVRAECAVPLRNFLGSPFGVDVARSCGRMRAAWTLGACLMISVGLLGAHVFTKRQNDEYYASTVSNRRTVVVPLWLAAVPAVFALWTLVQAVPSAESFWRAEELHFATSEMPKKDYIAYRAMDDRLKMSSAVSIAGTGYIGATSLFGPFLRADNR